MSFKKIFFIFAFFSLSNIHCFLNTVPAFAAESAAIELSQVEDAADPGKTALERWTYDNLVGSTSAFKRGLMNKTPKEFIDAMDKLGKGAQVSIPKIPVDGALGKGTQMVAALFTPPASGIQYIADTWGNVLGKPAYAQGFGFKGLEFLLPLWKATRNLVYVLSSIIFVVIGLMIILRVKISPQAVVTVQSAIPAVITTLILVTFSYAIAGLMIDAGNIIASIVIALIFNAKGVPLDKSLFGNFTPSSGFPILADIGNLMKGIYDSFLQAIGFAPLRFTNLVNPDMNVLNILAYRTSPNWFSLTLLGGLLSSIITGIFIGSLGNVLGGGIGQAVGHAAGNVVGGAIGGLLGMLIIPIILSIIIGIWLIQLYFGLIKTYVTIIFKIITGPLEIAMGAFPNSKISFSSWLLDLFANIMVFPIVTIVFLIINIVTDAISYSGANAWAPGLISSSDTLWPMILSACVGLAGLALVSKLPDLIPQYIFMIKPSPFGQAIGQNLSKNIATSTASLGMDIGKQVIISKIAGADIAGAVGNNKIVTGIKERIQNARNRSARDNGPPGL